MADVTKLLNMIDPEVLADMVSAELPHALRFAGVAPIDTTLVGQPGSKATFPFYQYIGDAVDVAEGAAIDYKLLKTGSNEHTIKKAAIGVKLTDESVLSGYGDPVGEAVRQITMSIANKIDNDVLAALQTTTITTTATAFDLTLVEAIENTFNDENEETGVIFLSNKDAIKLRAGAMNLWERRGDLADNVLVSGAFGGILGWTIVRSNKLTDGQVLAVKAGAARTFLKRELMAERERDIDHKLTKYNADQHYAAALFDETKAIKVTVTEA